MLSTLSGALPQVAILDDIATVDSIDKRVNDTLSPEQVSLINSIYRKNGKNNKKTMGPQKKKSRRVMATLSRRANRK